MRCFTQDDAHIFMTWDQMKDEIKNVVRLFDEVLLHLRSDLSDRAVYHAGGPHRELKDWQFAEKTLAEAITEIGKDYVVNEGDGAFSRSEAGLPSGRLHRPYLAVRHHPAGYTAARRFELEYTGADGEKQSVRL